MSREEETKRVIEYYSKTNHTNADSKILAEIAVSLAMIIDILKESEPQKGAENDT